MKIKLGSIDNNGVPSVITTLDKMKKPDNDNIGRHFQLKHRPIFLFLHLPIELRALLKPPFDEVKNSTTRSTVWSIQN